MGKPSIFSREYERKMKKRKRNIVIVSLVIIILIAVVAFKFTYNQINFSNIKQNIQEWIDSDTGEQGNSNIANENIENQVPKEEPKEEKPIEIEEKSIDITLASNKIAKAIYVEENDGKKKFTTLKDSDTGVTFDISGSGNQMIVTDTNSVITLYNVDGTNKVLSKDQYVSSRGDVFTKDSILQNQPEYLWNANPKFLGENKIVFVSNRPYFGTAATKEYIWITDINNDSDMILWERAGSKIEIGDRDEKGLKIIIDGNNYYMDENGNLLQ